jgi:hypothetical protein
MAAILDTRWAILVLALLCQEEPVRMPRLEDTRRTDATWTMRDGWFGDVGSIEDTSSLQLTMRATSHQQRIPGVGNSNLLAGA